MAVAESRESGARWGFSRSVYAWIMDSIRPWFMLAQVTVRPLWAEPPKTPLPDSVSIRVATPDEIARAMLEMPDQLNPEFVESALARGDYCSAVFDGEKMVGFGWRSHTTAPHGDGLWVGFEKPYRYGYHAYTRPEYRGQHISDPRVADWLSVARGARFTVGFTETHNFASIRRNRRYGNKRVGYAGYFKIFGKPYPFRTPGAKRHTFRFYRHHERFTTPAGNSSGPPPGSA